VLDIDFASLVTAAKRKVTYRQLPEISFVERDTAIVLDAAIEAAEIISILKSFSSGLIEDVFDIRCLSGREYRRGQKERSFQCALQISRKDPDRCRSRKPSRKAC